MVGNVGGYTSLFLGLSIIQLPAFCVFLGQKFAIRGKEPKYIEKKLPNMTSRPIEIIVKQNGKDISIDDRLEVMEKNILYLLNKIE